MELAFCRHVSQLIRSFTQGFLLFQFPVQRRLWLIVAAHSALLLICNALQLVSL